MSIPPPATTTTTDNGGVVDENTYRALVIDSGPIIRMTGLTSLRGKAVDYYTIPAVLTEIRDAKARQHMETLPFEIKTREPTPEGMQAVIDFSRQTGDYQSLSSVDLQVLALHYDLEREGCGSNHIRRTPKRKLGVGRVKSMGGVKEKATEADKAGGDGDTTEEVVQDNTVFFEGTDVDIVESDEEESDEEEEEPSGPKTWAMLVNPTASKPTAGATVTFADQALTVPFGQMNLKDDVAGGQFSDAEDDDDLDPTPIDDEESDDEQYADSDADISDEECDVYILDPEEVEERKRAQEAKHARKAAPTQEVEAELQSAFPSMAASLHVPYEGDDDDASELTPALVAKQQAEDKKQESLKPATNSGKLYNSFRKYGDVVKPKQEKPKEEAAIEEEEAPEAPAAAEEDEWQRDTQSRIIGGTGFSGQGCEVEDDGEGWVTTITDIRKMKSAGRLDPTTAPADLDQKQAKRPAGPPTSQRAACATTDFAMQNVILQMNLELLSVDGIKIRKLKSWVSRCGACFTVYSNESNGGNKRLFCARCGSDMMQRVACSVDSKTGRLRLHLSKKYKTSLRGTKFSLPKAGSNNRFQGDLLLREDQMMMGAWNQKVKKLSGGKSRTSAQSIFGSDLASNVGCHAKLVNSDDLRVGFGRRNPNASTGGRERRGKKKKTGEKACGLRRY